jgi:hypothetical protein
MSALTEIPNEGSTYVITVSFVDLDGTGFTPLTCVWSLTTKTGTVINARDRVTATVSGTSHDFVLSGDDLLYADGKDRVFTVEGTYDSAYGDDLPFRDQATFTIANTVIDPA